MGEPSICVNDTDAESGMARLGKIPLPDGCLGTLPCPRLTRNRWSTTALFTKGFPLMEGPRHGSSPLP